MLVPEIKTCIRTNGHGHINSAIDPDQEYFKNFKNTLYDRKRLILPVT